jgi:hypothetical protein
MRKKSKIMNSAEGILLLIIVYSMITSFSKSPKMTTMATIESAPMGVYSDINCTSKVGSIDWGSLQPGSLKKVSVYIRNEGGIPIYLSLSTTSWQPSSASTFMNLDWNYSEKKIYPSEVVPMILELSISPNIKAITTFSFNIVISPAEMLATVNLNVTLDQEDYVAADISLSSSDSLAGGLGGYELNFSATNDLAVVGASGGQAPFNAPPKISRADGKIIVASSISQTQGPQITSLRIARLRLRLNSAIGVATTITPFNMIATDASNGSVYTVAVRGASLTFMRGDANKDGRVSIADAMTIAQYLVGSRPASDLNLLNAASIRQDGQTGDNVTIADAMVLAQWLVGLGG